MQVNGTLQIQKHSQYLPQKDLKVSVNFRLDYQPLFGKGDRAPSPKAGRKVSFGGGTTRESGGNRAYVNFCLKNFDRHP